MEHGHREVISQIMFVFNDAVTLTSGFAASNARVRFRCDASGNSDYVYIDDVVITGCQNGTSTVIVANNELKTEIDNSFDFENIAVYPNPVRDVLNIKNLPSNARVRLLSLSGHVMEDIVGKTQFNVSGLKTGLYILQVTVDGETEVYKVSKQ